jgi:hypothetical protein
MFDHDRVVPSTIIFLNPSNEITITLRIEKNAWMIREDVLLWRYHRCISGARYTESIYVGEKRVLLDC